MRCSSCCCVCILVCAFACVCACVCSCVQACKPKDLKAFLFVRVWQAAFVGKGEGGRRGGGVGGCAGSARCLA